VLLLTGYFRDSSRNAEQDRIVLESLTRPALDAWVSLVADNLSPWLFGSEDELARRTAGLFCQQLTSGLAQAEPASLAVGCKDFAAYRNDALGDGEARSDRAYSEDLGRWLPILTGLLTEVAALADWRLCLVADCDRCQIWMGPQPDATTVPGIFRRDQIGRFAVCRRTGGADAPAGPEVRDLYPFVCYLPDKNQEQRREPLAELHRLIPENVFHGPFRISLEVTRIGSHDALVLRLRHGIGMRPFLSIFVPPELTPKPIRNRN
jgi:hypothetical protein